MYFAATRIGVDNVVGATLQIDNNGILTYNAIQALPGITKLEINPNASMETLFYDDGPGDTASTLGKIEVGIDKSSLSAQERAFLYGHQIDSKGAVVSGANDVPPWMAIGFRSMRSDGSYKYTWLLKGKFMENEEKGETKGDKINFQQESVKGQFVRTNTAFVVNGKAVRPWKTDADSADPSVNATIIANWFDQVYLPTTSTAPAAAPSLTVTMAASTTTTGATKATITGAATGRFVVSVTPVSMAPVYVGDPYPSNTNTVDPYVSGQDIVNGVAIGKFVQVYDLDANNRVAKFFEKQLVTADIK